MSIYLLCGLVCATWALPGDATPVKAEERIAGGNEVDYNVDYQVQISGETIDFCSGVILNHRRILTAAHCVYEAEPDDILVRYGSRFRDQGIPAYIEEIVVHPYFQYSVNYDIAYMQTTEFTAISTERYLPVLIPPPDSTLPEVVRVSGWGYTEDNKKELSNELREVRLSVITLIDCIIQYPNYGYNLVRLRNLFCAVDIRSSSKGACKGDGGSPAVIPGTRYLVGLSSFTKGCGPGMAPSVFMTTYLRHITEFFTNGTVLDRITNRPLRPGKRPHRPENRPERHPRNRPEHHLAGHPDRHGTRADHHRPDRHTDRPGTRLERHHPDSLPGMPDTRPEHHHPERRPGIPDTRPEKLPPYTRPEEYPPDTRLEHDTSEQANVETKQYVDDL